MNTLTKIRFKWLFFLSLILLTLGAGEIGIQKYRTQQESRSMQEEAKVGLVQRETELKPIFELQKERKEQLNAEYERYQKCLVDNRKAQGEGTYDTKKCVSPLVTNNLFIQYDSALPTFEEVKRDDKEYSGLLEQLKNPPVLEKTLVFLPIGVIILVLALLLNLIVLAYQKIPILARMGTGRFGMIRANFMQMTSFQRYLLILLAAIALALIFILS